MIEKNLCGDIKLHKQIMFRKKTMEQAHHYIKSHPYEPNVEWAQEWNANLLITMYEEGLINEV